MGDLGPGELILVLLIVVLLFGEGRVRQLANELGRGIREFRKGLRDEEAEDDRPDDSPASR